jgi:hypothetical protein
LRVTTGTVTTDIGKGSDMAVSTIKWIAAGALVSFGVVGFLTGLVLVPFGVALAYSAARTGASAWPAFLVGLGLGPIILLAGDLAQEEPPTGAVPVFWAGVALLVVGAVLSAHAVLSGPGGDGHASGRA